tara:strand:- start:321 stop:473 length:153 start_codon:yes stop_codon:yes gene_type:complete
LGHLFYFYARALFANLSPQISWMMNNDPCYDLAKPGAKNSNHPSAEKQSC